MSMVMMRCKKLSAVVACITVLFMGLAGCRPERHEHFSFEVLNASRTGLQFTNKLTNTPEFNVLKYMYFYNGAGVGAADLNRDGLIDLFFASNQGENKLFLNRGNLKFTDVSKGARIPQDGGWSTGVSIADVNGDGLLDIYVCKVGRHEILNSRNQLLICGGIGKDGIPFYSDSSREYGLDFTGFSTQAAFFDYDVDGDLDMFLLNHSVHQNGSFGPRLQLLATPHEFTGDRLFENKGGSRFEDVTAKTGIHNTILSYGLGVAVSDINLDGYPDIYVSNDFHENDYLYINQRNGTFVEDLNSRIMHTSKFSMGVDIADVNNDAFPEIITMDMMPFDPNTLKRSLGGDEYDIFYDKIAYGYNYQYSRNNLQYNRRNGMFSELGLYAGIDATDWSWAPLWMDFDNDGLKDLFISNGIPKRLNDIDYINYVSSKDIRESVRGEKSGESDIEMIDRFPPIKIPNKFFRNKGHLQFQDINSGIAGQLPTYSNGSVYADFDNDGDLDIVVSNIDEPAMLYRNTANDSRNTAFLELKLQGPLGNGFAVGARVVVFAGREVRIYEKSPVRGFLSSMETPMHIGLGSAQVDSVLLVWPDNTHERIPLPQDTAMLTFTYSRGLPAFDYKQLTSFTKNPTRPMEDITAAVKLGYMHKENPFVEFNREPLMPHMISTEGPPLAVADINNDDLDDVFLGSSKRESSAIFLQRASGEFYRMDQPALRRDSMYEDAGACWTDVNKDGFPDLVVASGGNEFYGQDELLLPRVYINDGKAGLTRLAQAFDSLYMTSSCIVSYDFNADGYNDLFLGGRAVPYEYGKIPSSYLLENDGTGRFKDVTESRGKEISKLGFVTDAIWFDLDNDGDKDLITCCEWGGIDAFVNENGKFVKKQLTAKKGWWNFVMPVDVNGDGKPDLVAGNLGLNSRLRASVKEPVRFHYADFDGNGKKEQLISYYLDGKEIPYANKAELEKQMPVMRKRYLLAKDFAKASLEDIFTSDKLKTAALFVADYFSNAVLINKGGLTFETRDLPWEAQLSSYRDAVIVDANNDSLPDILLAGNYYESNVEMGRYDADIGTLLIGRRDGSFSCETINGLQLKGQVRHIKSIFIGGKQAYVLARNNDSTMVIRFKDPPHLSRHSFP